jgi:hypothetical protein
MSSTEIVPGKPVDEEVKEGGRKVRGASVKALKKMLKKAGLKTTGKKAALTRRAKKAHLKIRGGENGAVVEGPASMAGGSVLSPAPLNGGKRRSRKSRGFKLF